MPGIKQHLAEHGYWVGRIFAPDELTTVRREIERHYARTVSWPMDKYHLFSDAIDHASTWPMKERLLDDISCVAPVTRAMTSAFVSAEITAEDTRDQKVVWRLVRPGHAEDVGPIHTDDWFWRANGWPVPLGKKPIKTWTMVNCGDGCSGLAVVPMSHLQETDFTAEWRDGKYKPAKIDSGNYDVIKLRTECGDTIVMDHNLLHVGVIPDDGKCRVSVEMTYFVPMS